jgi:signal transduction histidine kinase
MSSSVLLCYFSVYFPSLNNVIYKKIKYILPVIFLSTTYFLFFSDFIVSSNFSDNYSYNINGGYVFYQIFLILYFILSYITLYIQYKESSDGNVKQQIKYIFFGALCASLFGSVTNLIFPVIGVFNFTWLGPIFTLILVTSIFIAILRYHLFNIKIIITELFAILIIIMLLVDLFLEKNSALLMIKAVVLIVVTIFAYFLLKSVYQEVSLREQVEKLAKDLKQTNQNLEDANDRLKELDQLKSEFLSLATHQIRAPLTAIKGYASLILEGDYGKITQPVESAVKNIFESCQSLVLIVNDFLDISRIEQGRMKYEMTDFDISLLVSDIVQKLKPNIESAGLSVSIDLPKEKISVYLDQNKIKRQDSSSIS